MAPDRAPYRKVWVTGIWRRNAEGELVASARLTGLDATRYSVRIVPKAGARMEGPPQELNLTADATPRMEFVLREE